MPPSCHPSRWLTLVDGAGPPAAAGGGCAAAPARERTAAAAEAAAGGKAARRSAARLPAARLPTPAVRLAPLVLMVLLVLAAQPWAESLPPWREVRRGAVRPGTPAACPWATWP